MITGNIPSGRVLQRFTPTSDFYDEDLQTQYVQGQFYFLREGNKELSKKLKTWVNMKQATLI